MAFEQFEVVVVKEEANLLEESKTQDSGPDPGLIRNIKKEINVPITLERTSHPSAAQLEALIEILEKKPSLAKGFAKSQAAKQAAHKEWVRITMKLNSMGGSLKTTKKWIKYWSDKKGAVKKKALARAASRKTTSEGIEDDFPELSDIEERIIMLIGWASASNTHLPIPVFHEHESPSISSLKQAGSTSTVVMPNIDNTPLNSVTSAPMDQGNDNNPINAAQSASMNQAIVIEEDDDDPSPTMDPPVNITNQDIPEPVTVPQTSSPSSPPQRDRRRRTSILNSISQRRSNLMSITDKFLHLETQRLELEKRVITVMERNSETNLLLVGAMKTMGEGLKALADAIKR